MNGVTGINLATFALVQGPATTFEGSVFRGNAFLNPGAEVSLVNAANVGVAVRAGPDARIRLTGTEYSGVAKQGQYLRIDDTTGTLVAAGTGDVVGPALGATDEAIARFDTASGKLLKSSSVTLSNTGLVSGVEYMTFGSNNVRLAGAFNVVGPSNPSGSVANVCIGNGGGSGTHQRGYECLRRGRRCPQRRRG
jgi:hypothetical protein